MMTAPGRSVLYFWVKDPHWTLLWWRVPPGALPHPGVMSDTGAVPVLRIYDVTHILFNGRNAHFTFDVEITIETNHWYLNILSSNRNYLAEIGIRWPDGHFTALARSNTIYLPRDHPAETGESAWSTLTLH